SATRHGPRAGWRSRRRSAPPRNSSPLQFTIRFLSYSQCVALTPANVAGLRPGTALAWRACHDAQAGTRSGPHGRTDACDQARGPPIGQRGASSTVAGLAAAPLLSVLRPDLARERSLDR